MSFRSEDTKEEITVSIFDGNEGKWDVVFGFNYRKLPRFSDVAVCQ